MTLVLGAGLLSASPMRAASVAGAAPITLPASPAGLRSPVALPDAIDPKSPYLPQTSCHPVDMAGTVKLRERVLATYGQGGRGNISRGCNGVTSEHSEGRAWDWMIDPDDEAQTAAAADFLSWLTRNDGLQARRLGVMYVIYNKKIWSIYRSKEGWRPNSGHTDHIHVSLSWNGARGNVSFWTGKVSPVDLGPCVRFRGSYAVPATSARTGACPPVSKALVKTKQPNRAFGSTGKAVTHGQKLLAVPATGLFDAKTWTAVKTYQRAHDLPATGVLDQPTWASLDPAGITYRSVKGYSAARAAAYGVKKYPKAAFKRGRVHRGIVFLQTALGLPKADRNGFYDAVTLAAVKKMQKAAGLKADGAVRSEEWRALVSSLR